MGEFLLSADDIGVFHLYTVTSNRNHEQPATPIVLIMNNDDFFGICPSTAIATFGECHLKIFTTTLR
jgi:hypothetical protein